MYAKRNTFFTSESFAITKLLLLKSFERCGHVNAHHFCTARLLEDSPSSQLTELNVMRYLELIYCFRFFK